MKTHLVLAAGFLLTLGTAVSAIDGSAPTRSGATSATNVAAPEMLTMLHAADAQSVSHTLSRPL